MKKFDQIIKNAFSYIKEEDENSTEKVDAEKMSNDLHIPIQNFLQLNPDDQKRIVSVYSTFAQNSQKDPNISSHTISSMIQDPTVKAAFDAYQAGTGSKQIVKNVTNASQVKSQVADSSNSSDLNTSTSKSNNPIIP